MSNIKEEMVMKHLNHHLMKTKNSQTQKLGGKKMKAEKLILGLVALSILSFAASVSAGVPQMINYQGVLTDTDGCPLSGNYTMIFRIYDDSTDGNLLWDETHDAVTVTQGNFNVLLGSINPSADPIPYSLFLNDSLWLAVKVGNDPEMTPRQRITSVGYAFKAIRSDTAQFAYEAQIARPISPPVESDEITDNAVTSNKILDGSILRDDAASDFKAPYADTADYAQNAELASYSDTSGYALSGPPDGDWDYWTNPPHMFSIPTGNVGIGTDDPDYKFHVNGTAALRNEDDSSGLAVWESGDVIIGQTDNHLVGYELDVAGDAVVRGDLKVNGKAVVTGQVKVDTSIQFEFDYESEWTGISEGDYVDLTHNLGGLPEKYIVFLTGKSTNGYIHQKNYGTNYIVGGWRGCEWGMLTSTSIRVWRGGNDASMANDSDWKYCKVRILKNQ
jgi:hypothetical protein